MGENRTTELLSNKYFKLSDTFKRPNDTTAYLANDVVSDSTSSPTLLDFSTGLITQGIYINNAVLIVYLAAAIGGMDTWTLHLYSSAITAKNDNSAFDIISADRTSYIGSFDFAALTDIGSTLISQKTGINIVVNTPARKLYGILETNGAFTPSAQIEFLINLYCIGA